MKNGPSSIGLLGLISEAFHRDILPSMHASSKYEGLMICAALAIVGREFADHKETPKPSVSNLRLLVGRIIPNCNWSLSMPDVEIERELCCLIRGGEFDDEELARDLLSYLIAATYEALREVNPALNSVYPMESMGYGR